MTSSLLRLYPRAWRERYGDEFAELLEARPPTARDRVDILRGAIDARMNPQVPGHRPARTAAVPDRLLATGAITAGVLFSLWAAVIVAAMPRWGEAGGVDEGLLGLSYGAGMLGAMLGIAVLLGLALRHLGDLHAIGAMGAVLAAAGFFLFAGESGTEAVLLLFSGTLLMSVGLARAVGWLARAGRSDGVRRRGHVRIRRRRRPAAAVDVDAGRLRPVVDAAGPESAEGRPIDRVGAEPGLTRLELGADLGYEVRIGAAAAIAWAHWVEPDLLVRWMGDMATLEPHAGGMFRLQYSSGDASAGSYVEVVPPRRLVFTWGWEGEADFPPGSSTIELAFEGPSSEASTLMRLRHSGIPADLRSNVDEGWGYFLPRLVEALRSSSP
jgi:uncharacterized protein YndB with AHSA1/START domain